MRPDDAELFDFLEASLAGVAVERVESATPVDALELARELANADWSEDEAGRELARLASYQALRAAQSRLLGALLTSPYFEGRGIRVSRILWVALDVAATA